MLARTERLFLSLGRGMRLERRLFYSIHGLSILRRLVSSRDIARVVMGNPSRVFIRHKKGLAE